MTLHERREEAASLFLKGFSVSEVAKRLGVTWDTAKGYKQWHEDRISHEAATNPQLLSDVLRNTIESLQEKDQIRAAAWRTYHTSISQQVKLQALNTARAASSDKDKLYGLLGVKQDFYVLVQNVTVVQNLILEFLQRELCEDDKTKLEDFLSRPEVQQFMGRSSVIELGAGEYEEVEQSA